MVSSSVFVSKKGFTQRRKGGKDPKRIRHGLARFEFSMDLAERQLVQVEGTTNASSLCFLFLAEKGHVFEGPSNSA